jgi:hypothetical protein
MKHTWPSKARTFSMWPFWHLNLVSRADSRDPDASLLRREVARHLQLTVTGDRQNLEKIPAISLKITAVIYGVISKMTPQPCCTELQLRLPPRNVVPYKLPLASTMILPE